MKILVKLALPGFPFLEKIWSGYPLLIIGALIPPIGLTLNLGTIPFHLGGSLLFSLNFIIGSGEHEGSFPLKVNPLDYSDFAQLLLFFPLGEPT